jgi:hypothetical protein
MRSGERRRWHAQLRGDALVWVVAQWIRGYEAGQWGVPILIRPGTGRPHMSRPDATRRPLRVESCRSSYQNLISIRRHREEIKG